MFSVRHLYKSFTSPHGKLSVLEDINFEIEAGSFVAIVGESGSGKSTLLQIFGTLDQADSGEIIMNNEVVSAYNAKQLATLRNKNIGFVYQSHHLIPELTASENVMLPQLIAGKSETKAKAEAEALLTNLGLAHRLHHIPAHLSGGEAQRVAVARAIINKPKLVLADEPTGNLDEDTSKSVFSMMLSLCKEHQVAVVMVTHSKNLAQACDKEYALIQHRLISIR